MKVALCCIGRLENQYAVEFVEWYKKLGFDKITIYDNNHMGEEHFEEVLQSYIDEKLVEVIPYRNMENVQMRAYSDCYTRYKYANDYDWVAFFDFDEFLVLKNHSTIQEYLEGVNTKGDFDCVKVNWMIYTDNNMIENDGRPVNERFKTPMDYDKKVGFNFPQNNHIKSIVKCKTDNFEIGWNPHVPIITKKICNADGVAINNSSPFTPYTFENAYLKHFSTKTIDEFIHGKMVRGLGDRTHANYMKIVPINEFFKINDMTPEKKKYIEENGFKFYDDKPKDNLKIYICSHKDFDIGVKNEVYEPIVSKNINNDTWINGLKGSFYSEIMSYFYVAENYETPKYIGFCQYRRRWEFEDNVPDMNEVLKESQVLLPHPMQFPISIKDQYAMCHNIDDLNIVTDILDKKYPDYHDSWDAFLNGKIMFPYNMFIMKMDDFLRYIKFMRDVLDEYVNIVGTDIYKRIEDNKDKYIKDFYPNNTVDYQYRIGGYLAERLTNVFILKNFTKVSFCGVKIIEDKYGVRV